MKPTATLVNIARGGIVDDAALAAALREQRIAAAGLDVFEGEPKVHPDLLTVPNVVLTPHIASATVPHAPGHGRPGGRQPDRLPGARQAADAAQSRGAGLTAMEPWLLAGLGIASVAGLVTLVARHRAAAAQAGLQPDTGRAELLAANERHRARTAARDQRIARAARARR